MRDRNDRDQVLADLLRRVEELERATPLENSAIVDGPGVAVHANAGIHLEGLGSLLAAGFLISRDAGGSAVAAGAYLSAEFGGRVGAGATYIRSSDGAIVNSDGEVYFATNIRGAASATFPGRVRGALGVEGPINGTQRDLGEAIADADAKATASGNLADAAWDRATLALQEANAAGESASDVPELKEFIDDLKSMPTGSYPPPPQWKMVVTNGIGGFAAVPGPWAGG